MNGADETPRAVYDRAIKKVKEQCRVNGFTPTMQRLIESAYPAFCCQLQKERRDGSSAVSARSAGIVLAQTILYECIAGTTPPGTQGSILATALAMIGEQSPLDKTAAPSTDTKQ